MSQIEKRLVDFSELTPEECQKRFDAATETYLKAVTELETAEATVVGFLEPLDEISAAFSEAISVLFHMTSAVGGADYEAVEGYMFSKMTEVDAQYRTNKAIYEKFVALESQELDEESATLVETELLKFRLGGIALSAKDQAELASLNKEIAQIATQYSQRVSKQLATEWEIDGQKFTPNNYTLQAVLADLTDPALRAKLLEKSLERGFGNDPETDTRHLVKAIVEARFKRAQLLGYPTHADLVIAEETAPSVSAAQQILSEVGKAALKKLNEEAKEYATLAAEDG